MADNLCGPSNAAKLLQEHVGRDNSLQQDRYFNRPQNSQSFRTPAAGASSNAEFHAFVNSPNAPLASLPNSLFDSHHLLAQPSRQGAQQPLGRQSFPSNSLHGPQAASWVTQFNHMSLENGGLAALSSMPPSSMAAPLAPQFQMAHPVAPSFVQGGFGQGFSSIPQGPMSYFSPMAQPSILRDPVMNPTSSASPIHVTPMISEADLEAKFAQFEAEELEAQSHDQAQNDASEALNQHPAERDASIKQNIVESKPADPGIRSEPTEVSQESDHDERQRNAERLRQIAGDIVDTTQGQGAVRTQTPDKFRNSNFLALMSRIHRGDVVLNNDSTNLVDAKTGISADKTSTDGIPSATGEDGMPLDMVQDTVRVS